MGNFIFKPTQVVQVREHSWIFKSSDIDNETMATVVKKQLCIILERSPLDKEQYYVYLQETGIYGWINCWQLERADR